MGEGSPDFRAAKPGAIWLAPPRADLPGRERSVATAAIAEGKSDLCPTALHAISPAKAAENLPVAAKSAAAAPMGNSSLVADCAGASASASWRGSGTSPAGSVAPGANAGGNSAMLANTGPRGASAAKLASALSSPRSRLPSAHAAPEGTPAPGSDTASRPRPSSSANASWNGLVPGGGASLRSLRAGAARSNARAAVAGTGAGEAMGRSVKIDPSPGPDKPEAIKVMQQGYAEGLRKQRANDV